MSDFAERVRIPASVYFGLVVWPLDEDGHREFSSGLLGSPRGERHDGRHGKDGTLGAAAQGQGVLAQFCDSAASGLPSNGWCHWLLIRTNLPRLRPGCRSCVALAYWQSLLPRYLVRPTYRPWDPTMRQEPNRPLIPGQVLDVWRIFSHTLDTPAAAPGAAGEASGRAPGY